MESASLRKKIVFTPLAFIVAVIFLSSFYYIRILKNYHDANIENLVKEYNERQYDKIKNDVDRVVNFIEYSTKYKESLEEIERKTLDRVNHIDMMNSPYMFVLKLLKPSGGDDFAKKELELEKHIRKTIYLSLFLLVIFSSLVVVVFYRISNQVYKEIKKNE